MSGDDDELWDTVDFGGGVLAFSLGSLGLVGGYSGPGS